MNLLVLAYLTLAGGERRPAPPRRRDPRTRAALAVLGLVLTAAVVVAAREAAGDVWSPASLLIVLATLALASDALPVATGIFRISGSFLAVVLAAALLGPAPAAAIGVVSTAADALRRRPPTLNLLVNLVAFTVVPVALGAALEAVRSGFSDPGYATLVAIATVGADLANFLMVAAPMCFVLRRPLTPMVDTSWVPMLPWTIVTGLLVGATVLGEARLGQGVIGGAAVAVIALQLACRGIVGRRQRLGGLPLRPENGSSA